MLSTIQSVILAVLALVVAGDHVPTTTVTATPPAAVYLTGDDACALVKNLRVVIDPFTGERGRLRVVWLNDAGFVSPIPDCATLIPPH